MPQGRAFLQTKDAEFSAVMLKFEFVFCLDRKTQRVGVKLEALTGDTLQIGPDDMSKAEVQEWFGVKLLPY